MEKALGSLKHDHLELTEKFKESEKRRKELYATQINLATEK